MKLKKAANHAVVGGIIAIMMMEHPAQQDWEKNERKDNQECFLAIHKYTLVVQNGLYHIVTVNQD